MLLLKKPVLLICIAALCIGLYSCPSAKKKLEQVKTDTVSGELPKVIPKPTMPGDDTAMMADHPVADSAKNAHPAVDSMVEVITVAKTKKKKAKKSKAKKTLPEATIAYNFKDKMFKGATIEIKVLVQLNKPEAELAKDLKGKLNETNTADSARSDTSIIRTLLCAGYTKYKVILQANDPSAFDIVPQMPLVQELKKTSPAHWSWLVTAKKESSSPQYININVYGVEEEINDTIDVCNIPIMVNLENRGMNAGGKINVEPDKDDTKPSGFSKYLWPFAIALLALAVIGFLVWKKRRKKLTNEQLQIFFSYAWEKDEKIIMELYNSLKKDEFNVVKDKEDLRYKGIISKFMTDIGKANFVIVAISDEYLRSRFCMYELYEIYRNAGLNKEEFAKRIFPIRLEDIELSNQDIVNGYVDFWQKEEQQWEKRMKENSDSITEEDTRQYQFVKRLVNDIGNILSCLSDINASSIAQLKKNDFEEIKTSIRETIRIYEEKKAT